MNLLLFQKKRLSKGISLALDFTSGVLDSRITFTRASSGTRVNSSGVIESVASNLPRFDYDPVTLAPKGLLIEEQRTNLLTYSSEFENTAWTKADVTIIVNATTAPDGTISADKLVENTATSSHYTLSTYSLTVGTTYTFSVFFKAAGRNQLIIAGGGLSGQGYNPTFDAGTGLVTYAPIGSKLEKFPNNWYRASIPFTASGTLGILLYLGINNSNNYTGDGTSGIYIWGAQLEAGAFPTSYIPTTSATVTRAADNASMVGSNFSSWYNQSAGTIYCTSDSPLTTTTAQMNWYISDSTGINIMFNRKNVLNLCATSVVVGGVTQGDITSFSTITAYSTVKSASAYKLNDLAISVNGASVGTDPAATIPTVDRIHLGQNVSNGQILNGHIQSIKYYPTRLPNADLQRLTR
jgi:hypothetical protein